MKATGWIKALEKPLCMLILMSPDFLLIYLSYFKRM